MDARWSRRSTWSVWAGGTLDARRSIWARDTLDTSRSVRVRNFLNTVGTRWAINAERRSKTFSTEAIKTGLSVVKLAETAHTLGGLESLRSTDTAERGDGSTFRSDSFRASLKSIRSKSRSLRSNGNAWGTNSGATYYAASACAIRLLKTVRLRSDTVGLRSTVAVRSWGSIAIGSGSSIAVRAGGSIAVRSRGGVWLRSESVWARSTVWLRGTIWLGSTNSGVLRSAGTEETDWSSLGLLIETSSDVAEVH